MKLDILDLFHHHEINTIIKLSKIDPDNDYFIYGGSKKDLSKVRILNFQRNLFLKEGIPYEQISKKC